MPEWYVLTMPLLIILHIFAGIANAGVALTTGTIGLKLAPNGEATPYLAGASLATSLGAGLGPLFGGLAADFFALRQLSLTFTWIAPGGILQMPALSIIGRDFLFGIAFILGLFTLGALATIREEGEVGREVVLESLFAPMREFSRPMSSVPGLNFLGNFPFAFIRRVPVPGLDVALGVTVYQIAEMARAAASATVRGRRVTKKFAQALEDGLAPVLKYKRRVRAYGIEVTQHAARGAIHVVSEGQLDVEKVAAQVMEGVVKVTSQAGVNPGDAILRASQGIIQGAAETEADITQAVVQTIEAAKETATKVGLSKEEAAAFAAAGTLRAAEAIGLEVAAEVAQALPEELLASISAEDTEPVKESDQGG